VNEGGVLVVERLVGKGCCSRWEKLKRWERRGKGGIERWEMGDGRGEVRLGGGQREGWIRRRKREGRADT